MPESSTTLFSLTVGEFRASAWRTASAMSTGRRIIVGRRMRVRGIRNITVRSGVLTLGTRYFGFADTRATGLIRVRGSLIVEGKAHIAVGNRWDIGDQAVVVIGRDTYFSPDTVVVASTGITFGEGCAISWQCQLIDDDFHIFHNGSRERPRTAAIILGDRVWVGTRCIILKGSRIADGCVVGANTTVRGIFDEPNCLIAGSPARVIKRGISWR